MRRFICPRCSSYLTPYAPRGGGRFHGCKTYYAEGRSFTVEYDPPHKAYGDVAEDHGCYGVSQDFHTVPTKNHAKKLQRLEAYRDLLIDHFDMMDDFQRLRKMLQPKVWALGGEVFKKKTLDDIRNDFNLIQLEGDHALMVTHGITQPEDETAHT